MSRCGAVVEQQHKHNHTCELDAVDHPFTYHLCICGHSWSTEEDTAHSVNRTASASVWLPCPTNCGQSLRYAVVLTVHGGPSLQPRVTQAMVRSSSHVCPLVVPE